MTETKNIEIRLAEMAGEMKAMVIEVRNLVKLVEQDVAFLRKDHEHLKANHKAHDGAAATKFDKLEDRIAELEKSEARLSGKGVIINGIVAVVASAVIALAAAWLRSGGAG